MKERAKRTVTSGAVGGMAGYVAEQAIQSVTGFEVADGVLELLGAALGAAAVNRDLLEAAQDGVRRIAGKEPKDLTEEEWAELRQRYPKAIAYLERALSVG